MKIQSSVFKHFNTYRYCITLDIQNLHSIQNFVICFFVNEIILFLNILTNLSWLFIVQ